MQLSELLERLKVIESIFDRYWHSKIGWILLAIPLLTIEISLLKELEIHESPVTIGIYTLTVFYLFVAWLRANRPPKTKKGRVGFVVSIMYENDEVAQKVQADFIFNLRKLIKSGPYAKSFDFLEIPKRIAESVVDSDRATELLKECKAAFLLYGRVRDRELNGRQHYIIEFDGVVAHSDIPDPIRVDLAREFGELLPRKVAIEQQNDLISFQFTSEWADLVARYIIGLASALSGDLVYAERLLWDCYSKLKDAPSTFPVYLKLKERAPNVLYEIYLAITSLAYESWAISHDNKHLFTFGSYLNKIELIRPYLKKTSPVNHLLCAIFEFLRDGNIASCVAHLQQVQKTDRDAMWYINFAFLMACKGNLKKTAQCYQKALNHESLSLILKRFPDILFKVEDFIYVALSNDPEKMQLFYCLGYLNWKFKGDLLEAKRVFGEFVSKIDERKFPGEKNIVLGWLSEIEFEIVESEKTKPSVPWVPRLLDAA